MSQSPEAPAPDLISFATPWVGTLLTTLSGLGFVLVCMVLPLVGKAARQVPHFDENRKAFIAVLALSLVLAALAAFSKLARRRVDRSPLPLASFLLIAIDVLLFFALFGGLLEI